MTIVYDTEAMSVIKYFKYGIRANYWHEGSPQL